MIFNFISSPLFRRCFIGSSSHRTKSYFCWCVSARVKWGNSKQQTSAYLTCVCLPFKLGGLKRQKLMLSQYWRLEVQNLSVGRVGSSGGSEGEAVPCHSPRSRLPGAACALGIPWLVPTSLQSMPPSSLCVSVSPLPSVSYKTLVMIFRAYLNKSR